jgi:hypothetical protein
VACSAKTPSVTSGWQWLAKHAASYLLEIIVGQKPIEVIDLEPMMEDEFHPRRVSWRVHFSASNHRDAVR